MKVQRRAISPVLATVILVVITLIAAVAIATFVFGIFGTSPQFGFGPDVYICTHQNTVTTYFVNGTQTRTVSPTGQTTMTTTGYGCP